MAERVRHQGIEASRQEEAAEKNSHPGPPPRSRRGGKGAGGACDYAPELRRGLEARGLEAKEVWRWESFMRLSASAQAALDAGGAIGSALRVVSEARSELRAVVVPGEVARPSDLAAAAELRVQFGLGDRCAIDALEIVMSMLSIARMVWSQLPIRELRDEAKALCSRFPEEWSLLAEILNSSRDTGVEPLNATQSPRSSSSPISSMPYAQCLMPDQSWMNSDATAHNDNRALVSIMIEGPPIKGDRVELRGVAYFKFPTRVDRDDCGAEWEPNGELAYSPRRGAGTWVEVPVAVDHDDPFADRVAIAFPEKMWDALFLAGEEAGEAK